MKRRRLERLEKGRGLSPGERAARESREVLGRLTDEELDRLEAVVVRQEAGEEPTEEGRAIISRVEELQEEVRREFPSAG